VTILIGYVPTAVGEAALEQGLAEAALTGDEVVILNSPRRGATIDSNQIDEEAAARVESIEHGADIVEAFEDVVRVTGARMVVIGLRRRSPSASWCWAAPCSGSCWRRRCRSWP
jgi:hypothetical protein